MYFNALKGPKKSAEVKKLQYSYFLSSYDKNSYLNYGSYCQVANIE